MSKYVGPLKVVGALDVTGNYTSTAGGITLTGGNLTVTAGQTETATIKITSGATANQYLKSDANGVGSWAALDDFETYKHADISASATLDVLTNTQVAVTTAAAAITVTVPANTGTVKGKLFRVIKADAGAGVVTVQFNAADTIDGRATTDNKIELPLQGDNCTFIAGQAGAWYSA